MNELAAADVVDLRWPRWWRLFVVGLCALILSACRAPARSSYGPCAGGSCDTASAAGHAKFGAARHSRGMAMGEPAAPNTLPAEAFTGPMVVPGDPPIGPPGMEQGIPLPYKAYPPWAPPGIKGPWPQDEYLCDGGDRGSPAGVDGQGRVVGLELEDTVARYETADGRTVVEPSNPVCIYSPRFGAVRQVVSLLAHEQADQPIGVHLPTKAATPTTLQVVASSKQNLQLETEIATRPPVIARTRQGDGMVSNSIGPRGFQDAFLPYEDLKAIRAGVVEESEMAFLARSITSAIAWTHLQAVQIILDQKSAVAVDAVQNAPSVYTVNEPPGYPKLRVIKIASTPFAEPGDEVDFTIRFDNVGTQTIGNVALIDNLTTRLEYIAGSAQCSRAAEFSTQPNQGESVVLRCELSDPLPVGEGGILRFRCRVR